MIAAVAVVWLAAAQAQTATPTIESVVIPGTTIGFDLVTVPGGADSNGRRLRPFRLGAREVTWAEYMLFAESWRDANVDGVTRPTQPDVENPRNPFPDGTVQTDRSPAIAIGWYGAMGYCAWLTKKTGRRFRLPTEAEWALAASDRRQTASWNAETSGGHSHPVGTLPPNAAGLYDMVGNVWELCLEPFTSGGSNAVVRGGAWNSPPVRLTSRTRQEVRADAWLRSDPIRPVRAWWLTNAPFVGLRVASPADDGATPAARAAATTALTLSHLRVASPGVSPDFIAGLEGDLAYAPGNPPLDEVEVTVWFTDEQGAPQISDTRGKPAFGVAFPVLVNSAYAGPQAAVLHAGETRHFTARVPVPFDEAGPLPMGPPGGKVTWAGFAN